MARGMEIYGKNTAKPGVAFPVPLKPRYKCQKLLCVSEFSNYEVNIYNPFFLPQLCRKTFLLLNSIYVSQ